MAVALHILMLSGEYPPAVGGVGDYTRQLGRALIAHNQRVSVLTNSATNELDQGGDPAVMPLTSTWDWRCWQQTLRMVRLLTPEIVHIQYQTGAFAMHPAINLLPWRLGQLAKPPRIVVTAHDLRLPYLLPKADPLRAWLTRRLFTDADALILTNAEDHERVHGRAQPSRELFSPRSAIGTPTTVIPIGSNIAPEPPPNYNRAAWRERLGTDTATIWLAYFGLLNRSKGVIELLAALAELPPRFKLLIIGGAAPQPDDQRYAAEVQALITARSLAQRVHITGPCSATEVSGYLLASDLAVLPFLDGASYRRGSLLAALAHGLPTITSAPRQPLKPALEDQIHALLIPHAEPPALAAAIQQLTADPALQTRIAHGARGLAAAFSWSRIAEQHEAVYHTLLASINKKAKL